MTLADRIGGQAELTWSVALIKSARFDRAWQAIIGATDTPANYNINPGAVVAIAATELNEQSHCYQCGTTISHPPQRITRRRKLSKMIR